VLQHYTYDYQNDRWVDGRPPPKTTTAAAADTAAADAAADADAAGAVVWGWGWDLSAAVVVLLMAVGIGGVVASLNGVDVGLDAAAELWSRCTGCHVVRGGPFGFRCGNCHCNGCFVGGGPLLIVAALLVALLGMYPVCPAVLPRLGS
jgi:hypothetical protein